MTALNPMNPKSASIASNQRQKHKRRSNVKNGSVSSNMARNNKISPGKSSTGSVVSSPSIHVPGLPDVDHQQKRHHHLTSSNIMSSKSTLDDIDDLDETSDRIRLTNGTHHASKLTALNR